MSGDTLGACIRLGHAQRAQRLFEQMVADGATPNGPQCALLVEQFATRGMGTEARAVLGAMEEAGHAMSVKQGCQTVTSLIRSSKVKLAFEVFEEYLEGAGGPTACIPSLREPDWNTEHHLAMLTKALSKQLYGKRAHRVYSVAGAAGLRSNLGSFGLPALTIACLEDNLVSQAPT